MNIERKFPFHIVYARRIVDTGIDSREFSFFPPNCEVLPFEDLTFKFFQGTENQKYTSDISILASEICSYEDAFTDGQAPEVRNYLGKKVTKQDPRACSNGRVDYRCLDRGELEELQREIDRLTHERARL